MRWTCNANVRNWRWKSLEWMEILWNCELLIGGPEFYLLFWGNNDDTAMFSFSFSCPSSIIMKFYVKRKIVLETRKDLRPVFCITVKQLEQKFIQKQFYNSFLSRKKTKTILTQIVNINYVKLTMDASLIFQRKYYYIN